MAYYVAADGGGTKTKFRLLDGGGETVSEVTLPGSNNGRSVCFGRLVGAALAKGERLDGTKL